MTTYRDVLDFWFGEGWDQGKAVIRASWFEKNDAFDKLIRKRFEAFYRAALAGDVQVETSPPEATAAFVILFDQFPRNMYRDTPAAFASDAEALALTKGAVERGDDMRLQPLLRWFLYMPLEHSESLKDQEQSLALFTKLQRELPEAPLLHYAIRHHDIIARFGRFPHRNEILGRTSTPEELAFLKQPGSRF